MPRELGDVLAERVRDVSARTAVTGARSLVLLEASRTRRLGEPRIPRCRWCGRVALGGTWIEPAEVPAFIVPELVRSGTDEICPSCFTERPRIPPNRVAVHAGNRHAAERLASQLRALSVMERPDYVLEVPVPERDSGFVDRLLALVADCLDANELEPVQVSIANRSYELGGR